LEEKAGYRWDVEMKSSHLTAMYFIDTEAREICDKEVEEEDENIEWEDEGGSFGETESKERVDEDCQRKNDEKKHAASSRRKLVKGKRRLRKIQDEDSDDHLDTFESANSMSPNVDSINIFSL
jgi:hypothetical protein